MKNNNKKVKSLTLTPFRRGFTMLELIFVIILIAILSSIGIAFIPNYDVINDTNFVLMKIKEKQKNAISYDTNDFNKEPWKQLTFDSLDYNLTCIKLDKDDLNTIENNSNEQKKYELKSTISSDLDTSKTLCFDFLGRPYDYDKDQLLLTIVDINVSTKNISVFPMSGYAKIN
jgi:prepilin-type N-terminal cleavage/methylation domain-containing protein